MKKLFGTDGIRGVAGKELTAEFALVIGRALGRSLRESGRLSHRVIIGKDTRESCDALISAMAAGLCSHGISVISAGVIPTPAVAYLTKSEGADGGVMISASHNSYEYNGIKIFGKGGAKLSDKNEERIEALIREGGGRCDEAFGSFCEDATLAKKYVQRLKSLAKRDLDGLKIAVDAANGAASYTAEEIFVSLGARVHMISSVPNGKNINDGCGSTCTHKLKKYVCDNGLDCGFAFDGDADRCIAVDECGREIDGDSILGILADSLISRGALPHNTIVGTVMSGYGLAEFCKERGITLIRTGVGDRLVAEMMERGGYSLGGESSGHVIMSDLSATGDGQLTALSILCEMKARGKTLSAISAVRKYPRYTKGLSASDEQKAALTSDARFSELLEEAERAMGELGRIIVRPSGTEPLIRIMAEGYDMTLAEKIFSDTVRRISSLLKDL